MENREFIDKETKEIDSMLEQIIAENLYSEYKPSDINDIIVNLLEKDPVQSHSDSQDLYGSKK